MTADDYSKIMLALRGLQRAMIQSANYSTTADRVTNVDKTIGLIQRFFVKKDPPMFRHGAGLALDVENSLRRSRIETSRYECKQGLINLSPKRYFDEKLPPKIIETICGIANVGPDADGYIFIGVADKKADSDKIFLLDDVKAVVVGARYVVGLEREMEIMSYSAEQYLEKFLGYIRKSELSEPLKSQILSQIDFVEYKGLSVLRVRIPRQKSISFVGDNAFTRENSSTILAEGKKLLSINGLFQRT